MEPKRVCNACGKELNEYEQGMCEDCGWILINEIIAPIVLISFIIIAIILIVIFKG